MGGYILLELVIALTIFALAVLGLARSLNSSLEVANTLNRESAIRIGLRSFVEELRHKPVSELATSVADERLGVTYTSTVDTVAMQNRYGRSLNDLYSIKATATYMVGAETLTESATLYVYQPNKTRTR